ncbi:MAG: hydrogen peroxide-inducible genes activator [Halieaceae bacterium]
MTLTELRYLVALSETGHFRQAAEQCFVSQPTLSVAVKKLEEELGVPLFERARNHITATPIGQRVIDQARTVLREADNLVGLAELGKDPLGSVLSVGAIYTLGPYLFPRLVSRLHERVPTMPLYIEESYTASLRRKLVDGELDAIFVALPFTEADVVTREVFDEAFVVVLPQGHPLADKKSVKAADVAKERVLLMGEGHCFRDQVLDACPGLQTAIGQARENGQANVEGSSLETLKLMVASGMGITVLPQLAADSARAADSSLVIRPFAKPVPTRTLAVAWRASYPRSEAIDALIEAVRA